MMKNLGTALALVGAFRYYYVLRPNAGMVLNPVKGLAMAVNVLKWHGPKESA
jgi:hypothetical protein